LHCREDNAKELVQKLNDVLGNVGKEVIRLGMSHGAVISRKDSSDASTRARLAKERQCSIINSLIATGGSGLWKEFSVECLPEEMDEEQ